MLWENTGHRLGNVWPVPDVTEQCQTSKTDDRKKGGGRLVMRDKERGMVIRSRESVNANPSQDLHL